MVHKSFDKKIRSGVASKVGRNVYEVLEEKLHKPVIKKIQIIKFYTRFKYNTWAAHLCEMG